MQENNTNIKYIIGIDEVGRGPIAGPVAVGAFLMPIEFNNWNYWNDEGNRTLPGSVLFPLHDSKKLTEKRREEWFSFLNTDNIEVQPRCSYSVKMVSASSIDRNGIVPAIQTALNTALAEVLKNVATEPYSQGLPLRVEVLLDGGLHAPEEFENQKTIIKGDEKEPAIALASIVAKVTRDRYMCKQAKKFTEYNFEKHKGYGTKAHIEAVKKYGLSELHRKTFCKNFTKC